MFKIKHERTADCVVAGYRVHKSGADAIGSLLLGLYKDDGTLASVGVIGAFPMAERRRLFAELQPLVTDFDDHPWNWAAHEAGERTPRKNEFSRWNAGKDLSFVPLRPERVVEVRYDHMEGERFRHTAQFNRWRPDREPRIVHLRTTREPGHLQPRRHRARARRNREDWRYMSDEKSFNERNIAEFRANHGRVGGQFDGAPLVDPALRRRPQREPRTNIMMYQADGDRYLIFASKAGADDNPAWYWNLKANPDARIEVGDDIVDVHATELEGAERDQKYALQAERYPGSPTTNARLADHPGRRAHADRSGAATRLRPLRPRRRASPVRAA